jgi:hypothetical protein
MEVTTINQIIPISFRVSRNGLYIFETKKLCVVRDVFKYQ